MELGPAYSIVERKYGFDELYPGSSPAARGRSARASARGDQTVIDGLVVNGSARVVGWFSAWSGFQSGFIYRYASACSAS